MAVDRAKGSMEMAVIQQTTAICHLSSANYNSVLGQT